MRCRTDSAFDFIKRESPADNNSDLGTIWGADKEECMIAPMPLMELMQAVLERGSCINLQAKGCSMDPFIKDGDVLTLSPIAADKPRFGDVVAFKLSEDKKLAIHRVITKPADSCLVKGDCCSEPDGFIFKKDILGLVSRIDRAGRRIRFGLGPEKALIAFLSRKNMLWPLGSFLYQKLYGDYWLRSRFPKI